MLIDILKSSAPTILILHLISSFPFSIFFMSKQGRWFRKTKMKAEIKIWWWCWSRSSVMFVTGQGLSIEAIGLPCAIAYQRKALALPGNARQTDVLRSGEKVSMQTCLRANMEATQATDSSLLVHLPPENNCVSERSNATVKCQRYGESYSKPSMISQSRLTLQVARAICNADS